MRELNKEELKSVAGAGKTRKCEPTETISETSTNTCTHDNHGSISLTIDLSCRGKKTPV